MARSVQNLSTEIKQLAAAVRAAGINRVPLSTQLAFGTWETAWKKAEATVSPAAFAIFEQQFQTWKSQFAGMGVSAGSLLDESGKPRPILAPGLSADWF